MALEIFGLTEPIEVNVESQPIEIGTCTAEALETLDKLLRLGITSHSSSILKTALGSEGEPTLTTSNTPSTLPSPPKPDSMDIPPGKIDHKMAEPTSTSTSEAAKLDTPTAVTSSTSVEVVPVNEKISETEPIDLNMPQTKDRVQNQMFLYLNLNLKTVTTVISLPSDNIPIPEENDTAFDLDTTEGYSLDANQDINTDPPGTSKTFEGNQPNEGTSNVTESATYLERFR